MKGLDRPMIARAMSRVTAPIVEALPDVAEPARSFWFGLAPRWVNDLVRGFDRRLNSVLQRETGHPRSVTVLAVGVVLVVLWGPSLSPIVDWQQFEWGWRLSGLAIMAAFLWWYFHRAPALPGVALHRLHARLVILTALAALAVHFLQPLLPVPATEAAGGIYPHLYALLALVLMMASQCSNWLANRVYLPFKKTETERLARLFHHTDFMVNVEQPPKYSRVRAINTLIEAPTREPLLLFLLPAMTVILFPDPAAARIAGLCVLVAAWILLTWGLYHKHWDLFVGVSSRWLLYGGPRVISLVIVVLATCHVFNVHYVTTILQGSAVFKLIISGYLIFWLYEYWINRFLYTRLLAFLSTGYRPAPDDTEWSRSLDQGTDPEKTPTLGQRISLLGSSRFLASAEGDNFRIYMPFVLLDRVVQDAAPGDRREASKTVKSLKGRFHSYFAIHNLFITILVVVFLVWQGIASGNNPVLSLHVSAEKGPDSALDLPAMLAERAAEGRPAIFLAASGGGTRAAMYTVSVLCGLSAREALDDMVLASGVSGGGAALAYLGAHYENLAKERCDPEALAAGNFDGTWATFYEVMKSPFIEDVLDSVAELRISLGEPNGALLAESFAHRFKNAGASIADVTGFGLILNTALTGHTPQGAGAEQPKDANASDCDGALHQNHAGGRLVFTNLPAQSFSWHDAEGRQDQRLRYVVINHRHRLDGGAGGHVPLYQAAALNANFPPVFSDAGIAVTSFELEAGAGTCNVYWVTDGGAADNRGAISLLYALNHALHQIDDASALPEIQVIIADASAMTVDYTPSRGFSAIFGASSKFAGELIRLVHRENVERICALRHPGDNTCTVSTPRGVRLYNLDMPRVFTTRQGLGTHWKLPWWVIFTDPRQDDGTQAESKRVSGSTAVAVVAGLHGQGDCAQRMQKIDLSEPVVDWICSDDHAETWFRLGSFWSLEANSGLSGGQD